MSAIFGIFHKDEKPVSQSDLECMNAALTAFGQDGNDIWSCGHIGMGQREMHFTPEDSFQQLPLKSSDGKRVLVCDARVDNRQELMHLLNIRPTEAKVMPDSAFIMFAYERWGQDCVNHLIGDIVFALWDQREQLLLLVSSPPGERQLFYSETPNLFIFSTVPQGLFAHKSISKELDFETIADYLALVGDQPGKSFYRNIHTLSPGHKITVDKDRIEFYKFWRPDLTDTIKFKNEHDYVDAFNELFERTVIDKMRSITPIGVMMSGGLDSTSVAATAAIKLKQSGKRLATFTEVPRSGFDGAISSGKYADETLYVNAMARHHNNIDLNLVRTDGRFYLDNLSRFFDSTYLPFRNASNRVWYEAILEEAQRQGVRVIMSGSIGNLTISRNGDGLLPHLVRSGKWWQAIREAYFLRPEDHLLAPLRTLASQGLMPLLPTFLWASIQKLRRQPHHFGIRPLWQAYSAINPLFFIGQQVNERARKRGHSFIIRPRPNTILFSYNLLMHIVTKGAQLHQGYKAMFGVEMRDPTADVRIIEFCLRLPEDQYLKEGATRRLIRRAMKDKLPTEILDNHKRGLQSADWFERLCGAHYKIQHVLDEWNNHSLLPKVLDLARMRHLMEQIPQANTKSDDLVRNYRFVLESGLMMGSFINWFESRAK